MGRALKLRSGFSLMELCVAMLIFAIAMILFLQFSLNACMGTKEARSHYVASLSAEKKMHELRIAPFTADGSDTDTLNHIVCNRSWAIKDTNFVKRITVRVTYKSLHGSDRNITLSGVIK
jgi:prepilin-type N-terminal cleavage/methylation domain-containing protein